ncbi:putative acyl-CoA desaturase [Rosa chinensis]|uniref:Putative acyl-CoA desaturase n=1 Tax=Rosa chinensis TaxID=74649 RepID=A0A2P6SEA5_ROSCH|nr:putative acyl-CoA desaturase [Rosa chinensis]
MDLYHLTVLLAVHCLCLLAPFQFTWGALWVAISLYLVSGMGVTISYHRNLAHQSFKVPKWLEYSLAYCAVLYVNWAFDYHSRFGSYDGQLMKNVGDLECQLYYRFLHYTYFLHSILLGVALYVAGGLPFVVWGMGVRVVVVSQITFSINSICHTWGKQIWDTGDASKNNWLFGLLAFGEGWHNNHHAFEYSARQGLERWQIDTSWYVIKFLQVVGLATDVKLPTEIQKKRKALAKNSIMKDK